MPILHVFNNLKLDYKENITNYNPPSVHPPTIPDDNLRMDPSIYESLQMY